MASPGLWGKLRAGLARTQARLSERLGGALDAPLRLDDAGARRARGGAHRRRPRRRHVGRADRPACASACAAAAAPPGGLRELLAEEIARLLAESPDPQPERWPRVTLVVGVNGAGKTTSIAKLAKRDLAAGRTAVLAAGDTFRAAAAEQLALWGERLGVEVVRGPAGTDPAAVVYDAVQRARARGVDHLIVDTAGRLHNKEQLMAELAKVHRVLEREAKGWSVRTLLVLDATTGQNGLAQARAFLTSALADGVFLTKLDGTAKGGVVVAVARELRLPVLYLGVGERADDMVDFDPREFAAALLD
jgi:fused signal recognition particle receptor